MIELRFERRPSTGITSTVDILQIRIKDKRVESSTATPEPLAWSEWRDVPVVPVLNLNEKLTGLKRLDEQKQIIDELRDFAIWMTGCGYEFTQHEYFCKQRDKLLKD